MAVATLKDRLTELRQHQGYQKYFWNTLWLFLDKFFKLGVAFAVGVYVARFLGPEQFGLLNYAIGFVGLFIAFTEMGLSNIVVRDLVRGEQSREEVLGSAFLLQTAGGVLVCGLVFLALLVTQADLFTKTLILILAAAEITRGFGVISYYFQARVASKHLATTSFVQGILMSSLKVLLIYLEAPLLYFAVAVALDVVLANLGLVYVYTRKVGSIVAWRFRKTVSLALLAQSWPLLLYGVALHIQARIDQVMIGNMLGNGEVGQYSVALRIIEVLGIVPVILASSFSPSITNAKAAGPVLYKSRLQEFYRLMFITFLVTALPLFLLAETTIVVLYGEVYRNAGILLSLFSIRMFFTCMGVAKSAFITNESLFKYTMLTAFVGAILNVAINYVLIPLLGAKGAIIATIVSFAISIFVLDFFYPKTRPNMQLMLGSIFSFWKVTIRIADSTHRGSADA